MYKNDFWALMLPCWALGIILVSQLSQLPSAHTYLLVAALLGAGLFSSWRFSSYIAPVAAGLLAAWVWAVGWGLYQIDNRLPVEWEGQDVVIEGYISSIPRVQDRRISFRFAGNRLVSAPGVELEEARRNGGLIASILDAGGDRSAAAQADLSAGLNNIKLISVSWYDPPPEVQLVPGQLWLLELRLRRPYSFRNPGGFDYEAWTLQQGIKAIGYVRKQHQLLAGDGAAAAANNANSESTASDATNLDTAGPIARAKYWITKQRWRVLNRLSKSKLQSKGLIAALMLGERSLISDEQRVVVRQSGISHLLAISGLHLTLVGGSCFLLCLLLLRLLGRAGIIARAPLALAASLSLAFIWAYALWTGFSLPTQRAAIMLSVFLLAVILRYFVRAWTIYFAAMVMVLLLDPLAATGGGFYLSFGAVALVVIAVKYVSPALKPAGLKLIVEERNRGIFGLAAKTKAYGFDLLLVQLVITGGLIPLSLFFFNEFSLLGILINLLAIPVTSFIIMPWLLAGNLWLLVFAQAPAIDSLLLLYPLDALMAWTYAGLELLNQSPLLLVRPTPGPLALVLAAAAIAVLVWWFKPYNYLLAGLLMLPLLLPHSPQVPHGELRVNFLDVGQGLAVHLQTRSHHLIYDSGAGFASGNNLGQLVIVPYLKHLGVARLDALVISHQDNDHSGGMLGIMESVQVDQLITNFHDYLGGGHTRYGGQQDPQQTANRILLPRALEPCTRGKQWQWDGVSFSVLHPAAGEQHSNHNDESCVLLVEVGAQELLLSGDITRKIERRLPLSDVALLQVPHHGSKSSSSAAWLAEVRPQHAVFSSGFRNPYKHPAAEVTERYRELNTTNWLSWQEGMLSFRLNNDGVRHTNSYRRSHLRYWHFTATADEL